MNRFVLLADRASCMRRTDEGAKTLLKRSRWLLGGVHGTEKKGGKKVKRMLESEISVSFALASHNEKRKSEGILKCEDPLSTNI